MKSFALYQTVTRALSIPLCVYDNPSTTHFEFTDELHGRIAQLPNVASIKIPGVPPTLDAARARVQRLRCFIPPHVRLGISGDAFAATGLNAGCDVWYSVIGGLFPEAALAITRAAQAGNTRIHALVRCTRAAVGMFSEEQRQLARDGDGRRTTRPCVISQLALAAAHLARRSTYADARITEDTVPERLTAIGAQDLPLLRRNRKLCAAFCTHRGQRIGFSYWHAPCRSSRQGV